MPDGAPILVRDTSTQEIYALDVQWPYLRLCPAFPSPPQGLVIDIKAISQACAVCSPGLGF